MESTRRETFSIVLFGGIGAGAGLRGLAAVSEPPQEAHSEQPITDSHKETLSKLAEVIYPSAVTEPDPLIDSYLHYQPPDRLRAIRDATLDLDTAAQRRYGAQFAALTTGERETLLREMGVDRMSAVQDGTVPGRVRYFLVNGLLFSLFTDPAGSQLVGIDNPVGHPGGYEYGGDSQDGGQT